MYSKTPINKCALLAILCAFSTPIKSVYDKYRGTHLPWYLQYSWPVPTYIVNNRTDLLKELPKNAIVIEVGTQKGDFSEEILLYTHPQELYLIDCWQEQSQDEYPSDVGNISQAEQNELYTYVQQRFAYNKGVTVIRDYSPQAAHRFKDESIDWVYIDANHTYDAVKKDLEAWYPKIKPGGFLCGHDYCYSSLFPIGVIPAVNEFVLNNNLEVCYLTNESHHWRSYAIAKK